jgi:hypothetical protein
MEVSGQHHVPDALPLGKEPKVCMSGQLSQYGDGPQVGRPGFDSRQGEGFSLLLSVQVSSGAHSASYPVSTGGDFPSGKADGA